MQRSIGVLLPMLLIIRFITNSHLQAPGLMLMIWELVPFRIILMGCYRIPVTTGELLSIAFSTTIINRIPEIMHRLPSQHLLATIFMSLIILPARQKQSV